MSDSVIRVLRAVHGLFNFSLLLLFVYQASMGFKIRRGRRACQLPAAVVRRHIRSGPILAVLVGLGYAAGLAIVSIDLGRIFIFPQHFIMGSILVLAIIGTYLVSRRIGEREVWRKRHFLLGIFILIIFALQVLIGVRILATVQLRGKSEPPTLAEVEGYKRWLKMNREPIEGRTHGRTDIYVNQTLEKIAPDGELIYPFLDGTVIVKEVLKSGLIAIMRKVEGVDPDHNDWQWIEYGSSGSVLGKDSSCWGCHGDAKSTDYVFTALDAP